MGRIQTITTYLCNNIITLEPKSQIAVYACIMKQLNLGDAIIFVLLKELTDISI